MVASCSQLSWAELSIRAQRFSLFLVWAISAAAALLLLFFLAPALVLAFTWPAYDRKVHGGSMLFYGKFHGSPLVTVVSFDGTIFVLRLLR